MMDALITPRVICQICGHPAKIATCTVDENGKAVHEQCYGRELVSRADRRGLNLPRKKEKGRITSLALSNVFISLLFQSCYVSGS